MDTASETRRRFRRTHDRGRARAGHAAAAALLAVLVTIPAPAHEPPRASGERCAEAGTWLEPASGETIGADRLWARMAERSVVLLGESHDRADHHRWQLYALAALHGRRPNLAVGFEMFPRRVQPALDHWVDGLLGVDRFLNEAGWWEVWGMEPSLYMPLFHFVRENRVPVVALNVDRELISRVRREGWAAIPAAERAGLSDPAPAGRAYREELARVFAKKRALRRVEDADAEDGDDRRVPAGPHGEADAEEIESILESEDFARFVEAQLAWDRAMAEALAEARRRTPDAPVVGIVGRGHGQHGHGVPHQLADLGIPDAAVLLPVEAAQVCDGLAPGLADAVFVLPPEGDAGRARPRPLLGVRIEAGDGGVRIREVLEGSVAEASGLEAGDVVVEAAGLPVERPGDLIRVVRRQAPGTWLPLAVRRGDETREAVAKFPATFETTP